MQHFHIGGDGKSKAAIETSNNANYANPQQQRGVTGKIETVVLD